MRSKRHAALLTVQSTAEIGATDAITVQAATLNLAQVPLTHPLLSAAEQTRVTRFANRDDAARFVAGRLLIRAALPCAAAACFSFAPRGKPFLDDGPAFNLAHSGNLAAVAWRSRGDVGIDIESPRETGAPAQPSLDKRTLTPREQRRIGAAPVELRAALRLRHWVLKEAIAKAQGDGLVLGFRNFSVMLGTDDRPPRLETPLPAHLARQTWHLYEWSVNGAHGAVAAAGPSERPAFVLLPPLTTEALLNAATANGIG